MVEAVAEGIFHIIKWIVGQILFEFVFYWIGRITLLIFTLGQYPRGAQVDRAVDKCILVGTTVFIFISILTITLST